MMTARLICSRWSHRGFCANGAGSTTDSSGQQAKRVSGLALTQNIERPQYLEKFLPQNVLINQCIDTCNYPKRPSTLNRLTANFRIEIHVPKLFELIESSSLCDHHVQYNITHIDQHPITNRFTFTSQRL